MMMICVAHEIFLFLDQLTSWVIDWVHLSCAQLDLVCIFLNLGFHSYFFKFIFKSWITIYCTCGASYSWHLIKLSQRQ